MSSFSSGIELQDMNNLEQLGVVNGGWQDVLTCLLMQNNSQPAGKDETVIEPRDNQSQTKMAIIPGNYFWVVVTKPTKSTIHFKPAQSVCEYISTKLAQENPKWHLAKLEYMTLVSVALIENAKRGYVYNERLVENSLICEHGLWQYRETNIFYKSRIQNQTDHSLLQNISSESASELATTFQQHEENFLSCLDLTQLTTLLNNPSNTFDIR